MASITQLRNRRESWRRRHVLSHMQHSPETSKANHSIGRCQCRRSGVSIAPIIGRAIGSLLVWSPVPRLAEAAEWSYEIPRGPRRRGSAPSRSSRARTAHSTDPSSSSSPVIVSSEHHRSGLGRIFYTYTLLQGTFSLATRVWGQAG